MATNASAIKASPAGSPKPAQADDRGRAQPRASSQPTAAAPTRTQGSGLPLIGRRAVSRQMPILIGLVIFFLVVGAVCVYFNARLAAQNAQYLSTATEMQMLSQRIANSAQQAVQGSATAFSQLGRSQDQFIENLQLLTRGGTKLGVTVAASPETIQPTLQALDKQWGPVQKNIALILAQEKNLIELRKREETIARTAPRLSLQALELMISARDARERYGAITFSQQLFADTANYDFINAVRLLSTDNPDPQVALQLGSNTRRYLGTLKALLGEGKIEGASPFSDEEVKRRARELEKMFTPFAASVQAILDNMQALARAKQASREIFGASEGLLKSPLELAAFYQQEVRAQRYYVWGAVLSALLALGGLLLLGKVYLDDGLRRAVESERQNRANQDAILRLLNEISNLANGDLTVARQGVRRHHGGDRRLDQLRRRRNAASGEGRQRSGAASHVGHAGSTDHNQRAPAGGAEAGRGDSGNRPIGGADGTVDDRSLEKCQRFRQGGSILSARCGEGRASRAECHPRHERYPGADTRDFQTHQAPR